MEALKNNARNLTSGLGKTATNIVYILMLVVAIVILYYILMYFVGGQSRDKVLLGKKIPIPNGRMTSLNESGVYDLVVSKGDGTNASFRAGAEYTVGFWMYINSYSGIGDKYQSVLSLVDSGKFSSSTDTSGMNNQSLLTVALSPSEPKMIVRAGLVGKTDDEIVKVSESGGELTFALGSQTYSATTSIQNMAPCDVMDIDLQRWMYVAISVNGRILDVYLDGKLARSCILPTTQSYSSDKAQTIHLVPTSNSFNGYVSGVHFSSYAVAPDQIYANYQSGPYSSTGFLDFLWDKLNISITYKGSEGVNNTTSLRDILGL
jgi:hypothetical protein